METTTTQNTKTYYKAKGLVYGCLWDNSMGSYPSKEVYSENFDELKEMIMSGIDDGSLDSGMGYQQLVGAIMEITTITDIVINDDVYTNKKYQVEYFGELSETEIEFLETQFYGF